MPLSPKERDTDNLAHAHWRVHFRQSLLDAHRACKRHDQQSREKEAEYLNSLAEAKAQLLRLKIRIFDPFRERVS